MHRSVPGQQDVRRECFDELQRREGVRALGVEHVGQQLRALYPRGGVTADQGVAGDHDAGVWQVVGAVSGGVPGGVHRHRTAGKIQRPLAGERLGPGHPDVGRAAGPERVHRPGQHAGTPGLAHHLAHAHLLEELAARVRHLLLVQMDRDAVGAAQVLGRPEMVVVRVGDEYGADGLGGVAERVEGGEDVRAVARISGVDQGDGVPLGQDHPVRVAAVNQMDPGRHLDDRVLAHDHPDA